MQGICTKGNACPFLHEAGPQIFTQSSIPTPTEKQVTPAAIQEIKIQKNIPNPAPVKTKLAENQKLTDTSTPTTSEVIIPPSPPVIIKVANFDFLQEPEPVKKVDTTAPKKRKKIDRTALNSTQNTNVPSSTTPDQQRIDEKVEPIASSAKSHTTIVKTTSTVPKTAPSVKVSPSPKESVKPAPKNTSTSANKATTISKTTPKTASPATISTSKTPAQKRPLEKTSTTSHGSDTKKVKIDSLDLNIDEELAALERELDI